MPRSISGTRRSECPATSLSRERAVDAAFDLIAEACLLQDGEDSRQVVFLPHDVVVVLDDHLPDPAELLGSAEFLDYGGLGSLDVQLEEVDVSIDVPRQTHAFHPSALPGHSLLQGAHAERSRVSLVIEEIDLTIEVAERLVLQAHI